MPSAILMAFPLDFSPLMVRFLTIIVDMVEAFEEDFLSFLGRDLECKNSNLNESTNLWWRFSDIIDRTIDLKP